MAGAKGIPDVVGRLLPEAESILRDAGVPYRVEISRPTRDFFKTDDACLYVVRQRQLDISPGVALVACARLQKAGGKNS
jgi:hypothetical protein